MSVGASNVLEVSADSSFPLFSLPECFFELSSRLVGLQLNRVIISGNSTHPDALTRLAASLNVASTRLSFYRGVLLNYIDNTAPPQWNTFFATASNLNQLVLYESRIGNGATLPSGPLSSKLTLLHLINCNLTGTISSALLSSFTSTWLDLDLSRNELFGTIPELLFSTLPAASITKLHLNLANNNFFGSISSSLFETPLPKLRELYVDLKFNKFGGNFETLFSPHNFSSYDSLELFRFDLQSNDIAGELPACFMASGEHIQFFELLASNNQISGTIPSTLLHSCNFGSNLDHFIFDVSHNQLFGDLPSGLLNLATTPNEAHSLLTLRATFSNNLLNGTIATDLFSSLNFSRTSLTELIFSSNLLTGDIPTRIHAEFSSGLVGNLIIDFSNNLLLAGSVPSTFLSSAVVAPSRPFADRSSYHIYFSGTRLTGALQLPDMKNTSHIIWTLQAGHANFTTVEYSDSIAASLLWLNVSNNLHLTGTLPNSLFSVSSMLYYFVADNTSISGHMPDLSTLGASKLRMLRLENTGIDFCSQNRSAWMTSALTTCALNHTNAEDCPSLYPLACLGLAPPPRSTPVPIAFPPSSDCPSFTQPDPSCSCVESKWACSGSLMPLTLHVPSGAGQIIIFGNLSSHFIKIGPSSIIVLRAGCASLLRRVSLEMTLQEGDPIRSNSVFPLLILEGEGCSSSTFSAVDIVVNATGRGCKQLKAKKVETMRQLSAVISVHSSQCHTWKIVLSCVLGSIMLLTVISLLCIQPIRKRIFSESQHMPFPDLEPNQEYVEK